MNMVFFELSIVIIVATVLGGLLKALKQPLIPAYVIAGLIIGPILGYVTDSELISSLSEVGIAFLLFIVGLELDFKKIRSVAGVAFAAGLIKSLILFAGGAFLGTWFGFTGTESSYLGIVLAFSSTVVVVKMYADTRELDTLHGRTVIGILLAEDFLAILALSVLSTGSVSVGDASFMLAKLAGLLLGAILFSRFILGPLYKFAAKSQEVFFLVSISIAFLFALVASGLGLSIVIGAFIAGVALANLPYAYEIIGKIVPLKDFFATIFFVSLGLVLPLNEIPAIALPFAVLFGVVIIFKPLLAMLISSLQGFTKRPSFLGSISISQVSEFSLIIVAQAMAVGAATGQELIGQDVFTLTVLLAISTMAVSSYLIAYKEAIYEQLSPLLGIFEHLRAGKQRAESKRVKIKPEIILFGYNRIGYSIVRKAKELKKRILIIDYDPEVIRHLIKRKTPCIYGDVTDPEILDRVDFDTCKILISTVPESHNNLLVLRKLRKIYPKMIIFVTANHLHEALELYEEGAYYVILPHFLGGEHVGVLIGQLSIDLNRILKHRKMHIKELHQRKKVGHIIRQ